MGVHMVSVIGIVIAASILLYRAVHFSNYVDPRIDDTLMGFLKT